MADDFKNHPLSVKEIKSEKSELASDWSPRDALINMLRRIDSGELKPDALVLGVMYHEDDRNKVAFSNSSPDVVTTLGILEVVKFRVMCP